MSSEKKGQGQGARAPFVIKVNVWQNPGLHTAAWYTALLREYKAESRRKVFPRPAVNKVQGEFDTEGEFPKAGCLEKCWSGSTN